MDEATFASQYTVITVAMVIALVWDGINDPIMGFIVEKVHFKLGKFKPWILIGAIGNAIAVVCMFLIRPTFGDGTPNGWAFVAVMIVFYFLWDLFFTMNDIGYWAMLPALTNDDKERATITSRMTICASIGGFLMTAACMLLPTMFAGVSSAQMYMYLAIGTALLFLASQVAVFFLCQEKERSQEQEAASESSSLLDLFKVVGKNPQVRVAVIAMFLYYIATGVLTGGIGLNYFYLSLGYGTGGGGLVSTIISVMYVIGMVASQALYPALAKKMPKKKILLISFIIQLVGFAGFLICCVPLFPIDGVVRPIAYNALDAAYDINSMNLGWAFGGTMFLYYVFPLVFFFGMGMMYMVIMVMLQDSIDYNEYEYGERKESIISAWRPLDVKLSSALLRVFQIVIFASAGLLGAVNGISNAEQAHNIFTATHPGETDDTFINAVRTIRDSVKPEQVRIAGILVVVILFATIIGAWALLHFGFKIDEDKHREIVAELEKRRLAANPEQGSLDAMLEKPFPGSSDGETAKAPEVGLGVGQEPSQVEEIDK